MIDKYLFNQTVVAARVGEFLPPLWLSPAQLMSLSCRNPVCGHILLWSSHMLPTALQTRQIKPSLIIGFWWFVLLCDLPTEGLSVVANKSALLKKCSDSFTQGPATNRGTMMHTFHKAPKDTLWLITGWKEAFEPAAQWWTLAKVTASNSLIRSAKGSSRFSWRDLGFCLLS